MVEGTNTDTNAPRLRLRVRLSAGWRTGAPGREACARDDEFTLDLIERCRHGDREAFDTLIQMHEGWICSIVRSICPDRDYAWVQDRSILVMEKIWISIPKFRGTSCLRSWIYSICCHVCWKQCKRERVRRGRTQPLEGNIDIVDSASANLDELLIVKEAGKAICRLSEAQRIVIALRYQEELSYQEIADTLGISDKLVKSRIFEGRKRLRAETNGSLGEDGE